MQQQPSSAPSTSPQSFAGVLAALTEPAPKPTSAWDDDLLADDVATLSYEHALRTHGRYHAIDPPHSAAGTDEIPTSQHPAHKAKFEAKIEASVIPDLIGEDARAKSDRSAIDAAMAARAEAIEEASMREIRNAEPDSEYPPATLSTRNLKDASITIRLSRAECDQLHLRAAEAGMTISAYLRSCTLEAETLRTLVKETLGNLRTTNLRAARQHEEPPAPTPVRRTWFKNCLGFCFGWMKWLMPRRLPSQHVARA